MPFRNCVIRVLLLAALPALAGCRTGLNYTSPEGPRYSGGVQFDATPSRLRGDTLMIVTFNIENGVHIDSALAVLQTTPELRQPDVVALQEVDEPGTQRIAQALGMAYVYYPSALRNNIKREWGNAVLSRWPIVEDRKIVLPHMSGLAKTMRSATAVTVLFDTTRLRIYSTHLGTVMNVSESGRRDQLRAILEDTKSFDFAIIAGDMNSPSVGKVARAAGFFWPTQEVRKSNVAGRLDHVFTKGLLVPETNAAGTVSNNRHASDHKPVWARLVLR